MKTDRVSICLGSSRKSFVIFGLPSGLRANKNSTNLLAKVDHHEENSRPLFEANMLMDIGYKPPTGWIENAVSRLQTEIGMKIAAAIMQTKRDNWWQNNYIDRQAENQ
jgi:hypothetical protein